MHAYTSYHCLSISFFPSPRQLYFGNISSHRTARFWLQATELDLGWLKRGDLRLMELGKLQFFNHKIEEEALGIRPLLLYPSLLSASCAWLLLQIGHTWQGKWLPSTQIHSPNSGSSAKREQSQGRFWLAQLVRCIPSWTTVAREHSHVTSQAHVHSHHMTRGASVFIFYFYVFYFSDSPPKGGFIRGCRGKKTKPPQLEHRRSDQLPTCQRWGRHL